MSFGNLRGFSALHQRVARGAAWVTLGSILYRGALALTMIALARVLGKSAYGQFSIIISTVLMGETLAILGMGVTATKHIAQYRTRSPERIIGVIQLTIGVVTATGGALAGAVYIWAPWLARTVLNAPEVAYGLRIGALVLLFESLYGAMISILNGFQAYRSVSAINAVMGALLLSLVPLGGYLRGVEGALEAMIASSLTTWLVACAVVLRRLRDEKIAVTCGFAGRELGLVWNFGIPAFMTSLLNAGTNWAGGAYLVNRSGYAEMGLFGAANQWFSLLLFIPGVFAVTFLPLFSEREGEGNRSAIKRLTRSGLKINTLVATPFALTIVCASPWIMRIYGPDYADGYGVLILVAMAALASSSQNLLSNVLISMNRAWSNLFCNLLWACVLLSGAYFAIDAGYGAIGLAGASLLAYSVKTAVSGILVAMHLEVAPVERKVQQYL